MYSLSTGSWYSRFKGIVIPKLPQSAGFCAYGYMLSVKGAKNLIDRVDRLGFYRVVDYFMVDAFDELNVYCYSPYRVVPAPASGTDVQNLERLFF